MGLYRFTLASLVAGSLMVCACHAGAPENPRTDYGALTVTSSPPAPTDVYFEPKPGQVWVHGRWAWIANQWVWQKGYSQPARKGQVFINGYWDFRKPSYVWVPEQWAQERPGFVYVPGYWGYRGNAYVWMRGRWEPDRPGDTWIEGRWTGSGEQREWQPGHWKSGAALSVDTVPEPEPKRRPGWQ